MTIPDIFSKMIRFSNGNIHDIDHFIKVWSYCQIIGRQEGLDADTQYILEAAAVVHDIACPLCREKYGNTNGSHQEAEGPALVREFFSGTDLTSAQIDRIAWLVGHHHTCTNITGMDYQILIEADYIVNACEKQLSPSAIKSFVQKVMRTQSGIALAQQVFCL